MGLYQIRETGREPLPACVQVIREGFETVAEEFGLTAEHCPSNGAFVTLPKWCAFFQLKESFDRKASGDLTQFSL